MSGEKPIYKIGITHGDLNGISYEVIIKALADNKLLDICTPIVYGLSKVAGYYKKNLHRAITEYRICSVLSSVFCSGKMCDIMPKTIKRGLSALTKG